MWVNIPIPWMGKDQLKVIKPGINTFLQKTSVIRCLQIFLVFLPSFVKSFTRGTLEPLIISRWATLPKCTSFFNQKNTSLDPRYPKVCDFVLFRPFFCERTKKMVLFPSKTPHLPWLKRWLCPSTTTGFQGNHRFRL